MRKIQEIRRTSDNESNFSLGDAVRVMDMSLQIKRSELVGYSDYVINLKYKVNIRNPNPNRLYIIEDINFDFLVSNHVYALKENGTNQTSFYLFPENALIMAT